MRLSSLVVTAILLFSSAVFAQRASTTNPPSSAPAAIVAPSMSHSSSPSPTAIPESHSAPMPSSPENHAQSTSSSDWAAGRATTAAAPAVRTETERVTPAQKLSGDEGKIVPAARIGEGPKEVRADDREKTSKGDDSELRRRICDHEPCKEPETKRAETDLRKPICKEGNCAKCPPGESVGKDGKCATTAMQLNTQCPPDETWNGASCIVRADQCITVDTQAASLANEVRSAKSEMQRACSATSSTSQNCSLATQAYDGAVLRYRMLIGGTSPSCRAGLVDPLAL